jgi:FkbM family methyltransferase
VVLDLGAYSALTSVAFSKAVGPTGKVVALEPDPMNFRAATYNIARNLQHNGLQNIELLPAAVADRPGVLQLSSEGAMGSSLTSIVGRHRGTVIDVDCVTLQSLVDTQGLDKVDFIKMDIEGSELPVILGSGEFLRRYMPRLIIEPHPIGGVNTGGPIREFLESLGYECEIIDQPGLSLPLLTARPPN